METCGLTAEYNPFHRGHAEQLKLIRDMFGRDAGVIVCMSGPFCQHGVPALLDKGVRAELALRQGADLVIELPQAFASASAERFAEGAVETLLATGVVRHIAYGTENPDHHQAIREIASLLAGEPSELIEAVLSGIREGKGYAASRADAIATFSQNNDYRKILESPNSILAIEYEKALHRVMHQVKNEEFANSQNRQDIETHALPLLDKNKYSATAVRQVIDHAVRRSRGTKGNGEGTSSYGELFNYLTTVLPPESSATVMQGLMAGKGLVTEESIASSLLLSPRFRHLDSLRQIRGMQGGLAERLYGALRDDPLHVLPYDGFIRSMATRSHPSSRVRRAILATAFEIESDNEALNQLGPQYIRVLGFTRRGRRLLSFMRHTATLPVITNASDFRSLKDEHAREQAALDLYAQALWNHVASLEEWSEFDREVWQLR